MTLNECYPEMYVLFLLLLLSVLWWGGGVGTRYGDGAGNTVEENSSVFSLIRMH